MDKKKFWERDNVLFGLVLGICAPLVLFFILDLVDYLVIRSAVSKGVRVLRSNLIPDDTQLIIAVAVTNFFFFYRFVNRRGRDRTGRGILMSTFIYTFVYLILFYFLDISELRIFVP